MDGAGSLLLKLMPRFDTYDSDQAPFAPLLSIINIILGCCMFAAEGWAATTYDDGQLAQDVVAVYIGIVLFVCLSCFFCLSWSQLKPTHLNPSYTDRVADWVCDLS